MKSHTKAWKKEQLSQLSPLFSKHSTIGMGELHSIPSSLVQKLRKNLSGKAVLKVSKTRVVKKALHEGPNDKKKISDMVKASQVVIFSDLDPFELFSLIKKNQSRGFAKEGYVADEDIIVPAGDTGLPPGPALSELKAAGLQIKIQGPTIQITDDKVVTKKGDAVTKPVAAVLSKLDIKPVKVGLKVSGIYHKGVFFSQEVLDVDTEKMFNDFSMAYSQAVNLSFNANIFNSGSTPLLIGKAFREAKAVALAANIYTAETMPHILAKAVNHAKALKGTMPEVKSE